MILNVLNSLAATDSTNEKQAILKANFRNSILERVYRLAYHPRLQYGIKKIPTYVEQDKKDYSFDDVLDFLEFQMATRKLTGNRAIASLGMIMSRIEAHEAEVVRRIIKRDLECGASSTLANKIWKDLIPKQPQMLASSMSEKALSFIKYPAYAQLKADGARCFAEIRGDELDDVKMFSRAGNEYQGLDQIKRELIDRTKAYREVHGSVMVDGEVVYMRPKSTDQKDVVLRSETNGIANKSLKGTINQQESAYMSFQVWDLVPLAAIYDSEKSIAYSQRFSLLAELFKESSRVLPIETQIVTDLECAKAVYKTYVEQGLEGIILKNMDSQWENKRSKNLVKFKEELMVDLRIVDVQVHSKDENKLGAIILESDDGRIKVRCGSGFTDTDQVRPKGSKEWVDIPLAERDELNRSKLWNKRSELIGQIAEIKCNGWVAAEGRTDSVSLFLPIIQCIRTDKDEPNTFAEAFPDAKFKFGA